MANAAEADREAARLAALLKAIGDSASNLIYAKDREGRLLYANPATAEVLGYPHDRIIGRSEQDWASNADEARSIRETDQRIMARGEQETADELYTSPSGVRRVFRSSKSPLRDTAGAVVGLVGVSTDVTSIRDSENVVKRNEERLLFGLEAARMATWEFDLRTGTGRRSANARLLFGLEPEGADDFYRLVHPDDLDQLKAAQARAAAGEAHYDSEFRLNHPDGRTLWVAVRGQLKRDANGVPVNLAGVLMDITARKQAELAAERTAVEFEALADNVSQLAWMAEPDGRVFWYNRRWFDYTGIDPAQAPDQRPPVVHPGHAERVSGKWTDHFGRGEPWEDTFLLRGADGSYRWFLSRAEPIRDRNGAIVRWFGTNTDIHDRLTAEEELRLRVEEAVAERETALFQLHEAQKLETVGQLTGGVAHDFNNLLTPIVGSLDLLRRRLDDERSLRLIDGALASAERARTLIQRLLAFARRQTLQPRAVDPKQVAEGMRDLIEGSLGPRFEFVTEVDPGLPPALIDPNQLELALLNLSVNARDAMPSGGRLHWHVSQERVEAERAELKPGLYIRIAVSDTGEGMDADTLARAVEPFFSTKAAGRGTGLGLSMVHGLALQSGGAFHLESAPGAGTTATLWLPVADGAIVPPARELDARTAARRARVLLVDDEEQVRFTTSESLMELGYEVNAAASSQEALDLCADGLKPDLLVTDHLMPGMTGAELAMELRRRIPALPVLMITGYAQLRPEEAGDFDVLVKPYRHAELALRIAELLSEEPVLQRAPS